MDANAEEDFDTTYKPHVLSDSWQLDNVPAIHWISFLCETADHDDLPAWRNM